tara:strand:- start:1900 stop:2508 length:609 start_codon:yes stop_codon:yes gene_type:complete
MVSLNQLLTLGLIGGAIAAFYGLGGASGIGVRIGQGFRGLGEGFTAGISSLIPTTVTGSTPSNTALQNLQSNALGLQQGASAIIEGISNLGGSLNPQTSAAGAGDTPSIPTNVPEPKASVGLESASRAGVISQAFATTYSQPKTAAVGQLDVSKAFDFIALNPTSVTRAQSNYGGYSTAINQNTALAKAIEQSARQYPEYFA